MDLISVIIPVYNMESSISNCIRSIENQTYSNYEIIVIDDGSTDNTRSVVEALLSNRKITLISIKHSGVSAARNYGIKISSGKYVCFIDADDTIHKNYLTTMIAEYKTPNVDLVECGVKKRNSPIIEMKMIIPATKAIEFIYRNDSKRMLGTVYNKLFKKDLIGTIVFDEELFIGEDVIFLLEYLLRCNYIVRVPHILYYHTLNPNGIIQTTSENNLLMYQLVSIKMYNCLKNSEHQNSEHLCIIAANDVKIVSKKITDKIKSRELKAYVKKTLNEFLMDINENFNYKRRSNK